MKKARQSTLKRIFASRWFLLFAFIIAVLVALGYARAYYQDYRIKQEIKTLQEEVKTLEYRKLESMEILKYVVSDAFVEEKARTELNMKKPGENVLVIKIPAEPEIEDVFEQEEKVLNNSIKWWQYFSHNY